MADAAGPPLHAAHDLLLLDLDGVVYVGAGAVPGAVEALAVLAGAGAAVGYATNNASRTPQEVAGHLRDLGIDARDGQVTTSSQAAASLVRDRLGEGARVLPVGGPGVRAALEEAGLALAAAWDDAPAAVVQGFGRDLRWADLADAAAAVRGGALWVATNTDLTLPTERGPAPGNGSLVAAVRNAVDVDPLVAGKPEPGLFAAAAARAGARSPLVVGDRLDTDIAGADRAGMAGLLVLTGLTSPVQLLRAAPGQRPDHVSADLSGLLHPPAAVRRSGAGWACGGAWASVDDGVLCGRTTGGDAGTVGADAAGAGTDVLVDLLRACCAAAWELPENGAADLRLDDGLATALEELGRRCAAR